MPLLQWQQCYDDDEWVCHQARREYCLAYLHEQNHGFCRELMHRQQKRRLMAQCSHLDSNHEKQLLYKPKPGPPKRSK